MGEEHVLKTWSDPFWAMKKGSKTFEFRKNDRNFHVGDTLVLKEWHNRAEQFTGNVLRFKVPFIIYGGVFGIPEGYCIMSCTRIPNLPPLDIVDGRRPPSEQGQGGVEELIRDMEGVLSDNVCPNLRPVDLKHMVAEWIRELRVLLAHPQPSADTGRDAADLATSWATLSIDEETGKPYWSLSGDGWKDGVDMDLGHAICLGPETFKEGDRVEIHEHVAALSPPEQGAPTTQQGGGDASNHS